MFPYTSPDSSALNSQEIGKFEKIMLLPDSLSTTELSRESDYNNSFGYSPIFLAVHKGNLQLTHLLLQENSLEEKIHGRNLIHVAAAKGFEEILCFLCSRNARIRIADVDGNTPLHLAVKGNHPGIVNLLSNKNTVNLKNCRKRTPLHIATIKCYTSFVEILLKNGANANEQDDKGETSLHIAVERKEPNLQIVSLLLAHGASGNVLSHVAISPLFNAVLSGHIDVIKALISHGSTIHVVNKNETSPLILAIKKNNTEIVKHLLKRSCSLQFKEAYKMTPLHYATQRGNEEIVKLLLTNGYGNVNAKNENCQTPLYYAVINEHLPVLEFLLENGSVIESATSDKSLLHLCALKGSLEVLKCLIAHDANVDVKTKREETPLHFAASKGHVNILKHLIKSGADIHAKTLADETPVYLAVKAGHAEIVEELLKYGADINTLASGNCSGLTLAVKSRNKRLVQLFLMKEYKENFLISQSQYSTGEKALHVAAENGDNEILKMLLEVGCPHDVFWKDQNALHVAASFGHTETMKILIEAGIDVNSKTKFAITPLHLAAASGQTSAVKLLLNAGAIHSKGPLCFLTPLHYALNRKRHEDFKQKRSFSNLSREDTFESDWIVSLDLFENYLQITEMLLIKSNLLEFGRSFLRLFEYACQIRVLKETLPVDFVVHKAKENTSTAKVKREVQQNFDKGVFRPEIVRCLLNYSTKKLISSNLNSMISFATKLNLTQLIDVVLEYDANKESVVKIDCKSKIFNTVASIDHIDNIDSLLYLLYAPCFQRKILSFITIADVENHLLEKDELENLEDFLPQNLLKNNQNLQFILDKHTYRDVLKLLVARLVQKRCFSGKVFKHFDILDLKERKILAIYELDVWYAQCEKQLMKMRETRIHSESDVTFYDILIKPANEIAKYCRSKDFLEKLESSYSKFPAYSKFLENSVEKGKQKNSLFANKIKYKNLYS